ncbi:unnamed protein product [Didymodactylos carnosus]|uniref:BTB domain-containing protein n=1 Tax=Didymodactylos carnosus TaxID=1234261 RepID=A0A815PLE7_9BILA|nr:unnamed protein product [Didymodactylos carnosus]CAF1450975.1 unnamed protein product [Didymodactylos carnosus]CAF4100096.1 unnamed protein product [Didymodactylos carnosus]CAF4324376.1 unnamed protein product [Didymodactylos carnosus]
MHDIKLIVNDKDHFKVHRAVLAAGSDYFKAMFQSEMTESTSSVVSLKLDDPQGFPSMLKFLYTGTIATSTLSFGQIESLLRLADMYQIPTLLRALLNLITTTIDANNCLRLLFTQLFLGDCWITLRKECIKTAAINSLYVCHQPEFLKIPFDVLSDILDHSDVLVPNQSMLYSALHRWSIKSLQNDSDNEISKYMIPELYADAITKCNNVYKNPSAIICYLADGSEQYTTMTINATNSLLKVTPHIMIGILVMDDDTKIVMMNNIDRKYHYRVICKRTSKSPLIKDWNPTQYKLDIIKFSHDGFQEVYWMDSDTIVYKDMTSSLYAFRLSTQLFYFILDHVMYDNCFMSKWHEQHRDTFIPQACFMGFKSSSMTLFFSLWKQAWDTWTQPQAFSSYKDPNPTFPGSAFCIEQYALGNAVHNFIVEKSSAINESLISRHIYTIERNLIALDVPDPKQEQQIYTTSKLRSIARQLPCTSSVPRCVPFVYSFIRSSSYNWSCILSSLSTANQPNGSVVIDRFFNCLLHFYNQNYDVGYQWYLKNLS